MCSTDLAYQQAGAWGGNAISLLRAQCMVLMSLRARYALPGPEPAYCSASPVLTKCVLLSAYALAMQCPVLILRTLLPGPTFAGGRRYGIA
eukprot:2802628-Rhodomonas_salina.1